jgi:hypothetical protein
MQHTAQLAAIGRVASLYAAAGAGVRVDPAAGVIYDVAVLTFGKAQGHPFLIDATTLHQALALMQALPEGLKVRVRHPTPAEMQSGVDNDPTRMIGRLTSPRIVDGCLRADLRLGDYAARVPGYGDVRGYLLTLAGSDPTAFGLSPVIDYEVDPVTMAARINGLIAADTVGTPAANPAGLLSAQLEHNNNTPAGASPAATPPNPAGSPPTPAHTGMKGGSNMDPKLLELLRAAGLDPNAATPEQIQSFINGMDDAKYADMSAKATSAGLSLPTRTPPNPASPPAAPVAAPLSAPLSARRDDFVALENQRVSSIRSLAATYGLSDLSVVSEQIVAGADVATAQKALRATLAKQNEPIPGTISVGVDRNLGTLRDGAQHALLMRLGVKIDRPSERAREFTGLRLSGMVRAYLSKLGVDTTGMHDSEVARLSFNKMALLSRGVAMLNLATGDFPSLLADTIGKRLRAAYDETPTTWATWARRNTAPDFKTISAVALSEAPGLLAVAAGAEYQNGPFTESKETYVLQKFGRIVSLNWETIINDDLSAFSRIPQAMGQAARRLEDDVAYFVLLNNANMNDTGALFNSTAVTTTGGHANLSGAATISVAALNTIKAAMRKQVGLQGAILNLEPRHLIVPPDIEADATGLVNSQYDPAANKFQVANPFRTLNVVVEPRLSLGVTLNGTTAAGSASRYYAAADSGRIDTLEVCFLESEPAPVIEEEETFRVDGRQYKVRHTVAAKAIDWRGLHRNGA